MNQFFTPRRRMSAVITFMFALAASISLNAADYNDGTLFYNIDEQNRTAGVRGYNYENSATEIVIPDAVSYNNVDYPVTEIMAQALGGTQIVSVKMGKNVRAIGQGAFAQCTSLNDLILNTGLETIGDQAFQNCILISQLNLPESVKSIGNYAFMSTSVSGTFTLPAGLEHFGTAPFRGCKISEYQIAASSTGFKTVEGVLFDGSMKTLLAYPSAASSDSYSIPRGVTALARESMRNALSIRTLEFPSSLTKIGDLAFAQSGLTTIRIPASVNTIGFGITMLCESLTSIEVDASSASFASKNGMLIDLKQNSVITAATRGITALEIPSGIEKVSDYAFYGAPELVKVTMKDVRSIGYASFYLCPQLQEVNFSESLEEIGKQSFDNCKKLLSPKFPASLRKIGEQAFGFCNSIKEIRLNDGLTAIGPNAFYMCEGLESVTVPGSLTDMGFSIFSNCSNLKKAVLGEGLPEIPFTMFNFCMKLSDVNIPSTIKSIGQSALYGCPITSIELPEGLEYIGMSAIYGTQIEEIRIPDTVEELGPYALAWNGNLKTIIFGKGVRTIGDFCMTTMPSLTRLELNEGLESIGFMGISYCDVLESVTIPSTVNSIGSYAFFGSPLTSLTNLAETPQELFEGEDIVADEDGSPRYDRVTLYVPAKSISAYKHAAVWRNFKNVMAAENGVEVLPEDDVNSADIEIYSIDGRRLDRPAHGINIIRRADGTTRKIVVAD